MTLLVVVQLVCDDGDATIPLMESLGFLRQRLVDGLVDSAAPVYLAGIDSTPLPKVRQEPEPHR